MTEDGKNGDGKGRAIFISYRRDDSEGETGRLYDDLVRAYGDNSVFMDVSAIAPGLDFRTAIDDNVAACGVLLAVIGPTWATVTDSQGVRRLEKDSDFVRLEIASALHRKIPVIPVLVHDAKMPALDALPDDLKELRYRNSVELSHARWNSDVALLTEALKSYVKTEHSTETVHATVPVQLPAPDGDHSPGSGPKSKMPLLLGIGAAVVVAAGIGFAVLHKPTPDPSPTPVVSADGAKALLGKWKSATDVRGGDDLERITVAEFDGQLVVQAWGKCQPKDCDWGSRKATLTGANAVTERWDLRNTPQENADQRQAVISLAPSSAGLQVTVKNTYQMPNGKARELLNPMQFVKE